jgi:hypothetical protein
MRILRYALVGLLAVGLVVTSVGWYLSTRTGERRFDSCRLDGDLLTLSYSYGANEMVSPSIDTRGPDVVVALRTHVGDGITPAIRLTGQARFTVFSGPRTVRYPDGDQLNCGVG